MEAARRGKRKPQRGSAKSGGTYSGSREDSRDPQLFGALIGRLVAERGWRKPTAQGRIFGAWDQLVGADVAAKCQPVSLRDGELVLAATSTAWATQLRLLSGKILRQIQKELGREADADLAGLVKTIRVHGPTGPTWKHGNRSVPGRGPRDTYG